MFKKKKLLIDWNNVEKTDCLFQSVQNLSVICEDDKILHLNHDAKLSFDVNYSANIFSNDFICLWVEYVLYEFQKGEESVI